MHDPATLAQSVRLSGMLFQRFLAGFDDANRTTQAPALPNHAAWTLGHLAITLHRAAEKLDAGGDPLPESDFIDGADRGDSDRFGTESVCFGSTPTDDPAGYPSWARCRDIFAAGIERLAAAAESASADQLAAKVSWGSGELPAGDLVHRLAFHQGTHAGQIADLRRALGLGSIFG